MPRRFLVLVGVLVLAVVQVVEPTTAAGASPAHPDAASGIRRHLHLGRVRLLLRAEREVVTVYDGDCHAGPGGRHTGHYLLQSEIAGRTVSSIDVGSLTLAVGQRHDGLRTVRIPGVGRVAAIYQPDGCQWSQLRLFRVDRGGRLVPIRFVDDTGAERSQGWTTRLPTAGATRLLELCMRSTELRATSLPGYACASYRYVRGRLVFEHEREHPDIELLRKASVSTTSVGGYRLFLYAGDERSEVGGGASCFTDAGTRRVSGHYALIATKGDRTVSMLAIGLRYFAEGRLHDGLRTVRASGQRLLAIPSFLACNGGAVTLYRVTADGTIAPVPIVGPLDAEIESLPTSYAPALEDARGPLVFCDWGGVSNPFCTAYRFDGARLVWSDAWEPTAIDPEAWRHPTAEGRARATLSRFLALLAKTDTSRAATIYDGSAADLLRFLASCPERRLPAIEAIARPMRRRGRAVELTAHLLDREETLTFGMRERGRSFRVARLPSCAGS